MDGEVAHIRCPYYFQFVLWEYELECAAQRRDASDASQGVQQEAAHRMNGGHPTDSIRSRDASRDDRSRADDREEGNCMGQESGNDVQGSVSREPVKNGIDSVNFPRDCSSDSHRAHSPQVPFPPQRSSKEICFTQSAMGMDSAKWSDVQTDM